MRIATWNVNGLRARLPRLLEYLAEQAPDVLLVQELKLEEHELPTLELRGAGYQAAAVGQKSWNGVAVFAKSAPEVVATSLTGADPELGARFVHARVGGVEVASVYVPNGKTTSHPDFPRKLAFLDALGAYVADIPEGRPFVLGGDFNLCATDLDTFAPDRLRGTIFHTEDERARFQRILGGALVDVFRDRHPDTPGFSWWDYRGGSFHKNEGLRIDLLLATRELAAKVTSTAVLRDYRKKSKAGAVPSDHTPVTLDVDV